MSDTIEDIRARFLQDGPSRLRCCSDRITLLAEVDRQRAEIELLTRERDEARAAFKPFASEAEAYDPPEGDDEHPAWASRFTCGNLRDARKALESKP